MLATEYLSFASFIRSDTKDPTVSKLRSMLSTTPLPLTVKRIVVDVIEKSIVLIKRDPAKARLEALENYSKLLVTIRKMTESDKLLEQVRFYCSPIVMSNFTFALNIAAQIVPLIALSVQQSPPHMIDHSLYTNDAIKRFRDIVLSDTKVPRITQDRDAGQFDVLSQLIFSFNIGVLLFLIGLVVLLAQGEFSLEEPAIEDLEYMLRDWAQESITQFVTLTKESSVLSPTFRVRAVPLDDEQSINL